MVEEARKRLTREAKKQHEQSEAKKRNEQVTAKRKITYRLSGIKKPEVTCKCAKNKGKKKREKNDKNT
ncbi:Hypothetical predicted protein [Octopus vulgaris]|uniref:Uncharacterized protein n=1 Tax=Octopus vulgaris TaxID=6645 RepID=A0AA36EWP3_OCTVU|nr:Hypothetical predicted protein [Octopus vulgaris]